MDPQRVRSVHLFAGLGKSDLRRIAQVADEVDVREGTELLHEGNFAHEFMAITDGRAEVVREGQRVAELGPGDFMGEAAALSHGQRNASIVASTPMTLMVMTARDLRAIAREMPAIDKSLREAAQAHAQPQA